MSRRLLRRSLVPAERRFGGAAGLSVARAPAHAQSWRRRQRHAVEKISSRPYPSWLIRGQVERRSWNDPELDEAFFRRGVPVASPADVRSPRNSSAYGTSAIFANIIVAATATLPSTTHRGRRLASIGSTAKALARAACSASPFASLPNAYAQVAILAITCNRPSCGARRLGLVIARAHPAARLTPTGRRSCTMGRMATRWRLICRIRSIGDGSQRYAKHAATRASNPSHCGRAMAVEPRPYTTT